VTNGNGRLFIQTLCPANADIGLFHGDDLYAYPGQNFPPRADLNRAPECRMQISPTTENTLHHFLHVLTAADAATQSVPVATTTRDARNLTVHLPNIQITFNLDGPEA